MKFSILAKIDNMDTNGVISGYAVKWAAAPFKQDNGKAITISFLPTAFNECLASRKAIFANIEHSRSDLLARYPKTMKLNADKVGLKYSIHIPDTKKGKDAKTLIDLGDYSCLSVVISVDNPDTTITKNQDGTWSMTCRKAMIQELSLVSSFPTDAEYSIDMQTEYDLQRKQWHLAKLKTLEL